MEDFNTHGIPPGWILSLPEFEKCLEHSGQSKRTYGQRLNRLLKLGEKYKKDPIGLLYDMYFKEQKTLKEINGELKIYTDPSSLFTLFSNLGWKLRNANEESVLKTREPKRQEAFAEEMSKKTKKQTQKFNGELTNLLDISQNVSRKIFNQTEYNSYKTNIRKILYLLEVYGGITKETILLACSNTKVESSYYFKVIENILEDICKKNGITSIPKTNANNLRAWIRNNSVPSQ